jgi:2-methylisocitrate lyase-like PEP mutase family enzyme
VASLIEEVKYNMNGIALFLNIRTDTFLLDVPDALEETCNRARKYEKAGANGLFVPCILQEQDIRRVVQATPLPLNLMCMPGLPAADRLMHLGVRRLSMGNFAFDYINRALRTAMAGVLNSGSFSHIL